MMVSSYIRVRVLAAAFRQASRIAGTLHLPVFSQSRRKAATHLCWNYF
jgi:hypothetical protein